ncbi:MAG: glycosyltransferase [Rickettsiales bacterium]|jgi:glycosyltransferase involved in cell wall biosynthesis|nr:glycosyltransferase [Rickettsiales bacterium]
MSQVPEISVILINFNNQDYISDAIFSVKNQTYKDWECIIVDDGSTDDSRNIIESATKGDKRFRVIHQENRGASAARNRGLDAACGKYIMFLDSDDAYTPIAMRTLHSVAELHQADLAGGRSLAVRNDFRLLQAKSSFENIMGDIPCFFVSGENPLREYADIFYQIGTDQKFLWVWRQIFRRDLIKGKYFQEDLFPGEDIMFMLDILRDVKKIALTEYPVVYHRISRTSSVNNEMNERNITYQVKVLPRLVKILSFFPHTFAKIAMQEFHNLIFYESVIRTLRAPKFRELAANALAEVYDTADFDKTLIRKWQRIVIRLFILSFARRK